MRNKYNLSKAVVEWLKYSDYDNKGSISVTELKNPIREIVIKRNMKLILGDVLDVSDYAYTRPGTALHDSFEKINYEGMIPGHDKRLFWEVLGEKVSGEFDFMDAVENFPKLSSAILRHQGRLSLPSQEKELVICDLKFTGCWSIANWERLSWRYQLSAYRWLAVKNGYKNIYDVGMIIAFASDWSKENQRKYHLEGCRIQEIPITLYTPEESERTIAGRMAELKPYLNETDINKLPECTDEEKRDFGGKKCLQYCGARYVCPDSPCAYGD